MCPTIILDKEKENKEKVRMVVGAEGGTNITTSVAQVIQISGDFNNLRTDRLHTTQHEKQNQYIDTSEQTNVS